MKIYLVGGAVRDILLGRVPHDKDYVVVGSSPEEMLSLGYKQVGNEFPVFLHPQTGEEYALARKEISTGDGYQDFKFDFNPDITLKEDLIRRDFTCNALALDLETDKIIDYFGGQKDIENKVIRHVSNHFSEDPLRVLRFCRFQAQLNFTGDKETVELCRKMVAEGMIKHLTPERVWMEIEKALCTIRFDMFITALDEANALDIILPEIYNLKQVPEKLEYHPEGNSFAHLILTFQQVEHQFNAWGLSIERELNEIKDEIALVNFGLLCHDLGKTLTKECWPSHHGHEILGLDIVDSLCDRLRVPNEYRDFGKLACKYHMCFYEFLQSKVKHQYDKVKEWTKNFKDNKNARLLMKLHACDLCGRDGKISEDRIERYWNTIHKINVITNIMWNITLKDLPEETQKNLFRFKGEQFGKLYRDAMISYLKLHLRNIRQND